jgi:polyhydroxybutyrate depolymerase
MLAVLLAVAGALALAATTNQPQRAIAAEDCQPLRGNHMLGDALLHVPAHVKLPAPLVVVFHGAGGDGPGMASYSGMSKTADDEGFAVLYPTAGSAHHFWALNASMPGDDINRLKALLPKAEQAACADPYKLFATGVSNGGGFAARVGCEMSDTFAGIAPVAGGYRALDPCPDGHRVSVLEIHGTADHVVPYNGAPPDYKGAVAGFLAGWIRRDGCEAAAERSNPSHGVTRFNHEHCATGYRVEHLRLTGTDHGWPGADPPFPKHNPSQLVANDEIWDFFAHTVLNASAGASRAARSAG